MISKNPLRKVGGRLDVGFAEGVDKVAETQTFLYIVRVPRYTCEEDIQISLKKEYSCNHPHISELPDAHPLPLTN